MISDVLADAVVAIDEYLQDDFYTGITRLEIESLRAQMILMHWKLDASNSNQSEFISAFKKGYAQNASK